MAGHKQHTPLSCLISSHVVRPQVRSAPRFIRSEHRTHVARVIEQSKSRQEAFVESIEEELAKQRLEAEESVVATDIGQLQQQVDGLEQQVRTVQAA